MEFIGNWEGYLNFEETWMTLLEELIETTKNYRNDLVRRLEGTGGKILNGTGNKPLRTSE